MKAIIENGKVNSGIQSCFIAEYGVGIKIPYTLIAHLRVFAKCGSRFCFVYHSL